MRLFAVLSISLILLSTGCASRTSASESSDVSNGKTMIQLSKEDLTAEEDPSSSGERESDPQYVAPIADGEWKLVLVNDRNGLAENFAPELAEVQGIYQMDSRIVPIMQQMIADAKGQGISLMVCSAYRPYSSQQRNFEASVTRYVQQGYSREQAEATTLKLIAAPGFSEHQTGLAADIVTPSYQGLDDGYADTDAARWLKANAASYGFILRYPKDKTEITHIDFEPWHYRYVGEEVAKKIMEEGLCLEEYLGYGQA